MSAGLPGLGLGGLFFVLSALLAPLPELRRTLTGRSRPGAWRQVGRQFAIALAIVALVGWMVPLKPIGITTALLAVILLTAKAAQLGLRGSARISALRARTRADLCPQACTCCTDARS